MPGRSPIPLPLHSAEARSTFASRQRLLNLYPEQSPDQAKGPVTLYSTPGLKSWLSSGIGNGPIRGMHKMGGYLWVVSGSELYRVSSIKGVTQITGTLDGSGNVHMTDNGTHIAICTSTKAYYANATDLINELPEATLNGATYQDGYGIYTQEGTQFFWLSGLDDLTTIDALDFESVDSFTDNVVGLISDHREVWIFGERSVTVYYNSGNAAFPFTRAQAGFIERGCASSFSIAKIENTVFWLGDDFAVYAAPGYQHRRISTPWVESRILEQQSRNVAKAFTYTQDGHSWYVLSFPALTIAYDIAGDRWHERQTFGADRWRANNYTFFTDKHLVGDFETGEIYEIDVDTHTDDGVGRQYQIICPAIQASRSRVSMSELILDAEVGVGEDWANWDGSTILVGGVSTDYLEGENPEVLLDWSDDGGKTWSTPVSRNLGKLGDYDNEIVWHGLGAFKQRILRFTVKAPCRMTVSGLYARLEGWD